MVWRGYGRLSVLPFLLVLPTALGRLATNSVTEVERPFQGVLDWNTATVKTARKLLSLSLHGRLARTKALMGALDDDSDMLHDDIVAMRRDIASFSSLPPTGTELESMSPEELEHELLTAKMRRVDSRADWELHKADVLHAKSRVQVARARKDSAAEASARADIEAASEKEKAAEAAHEMAHAYHEEVAAQLEKQGYAQREVSQSGYRKVSAERDSTHRETQVAASSGATTDTEARAKERVDANAETEADTTKNKHASARDAAARAKAEAEAEAAMEAEKRAIAAEAEKKARSVDKAEAKANAAQKAAAEARQRAAAKKEAQKAEKRAARREGSQGSSSMHDASNNHVWWRSPDLVPEVKNPWWSAPHRDACGRFATAPSLPLLVLPTLYVGLFY